MKHYDEIAKKGNELALADPFFNEFFGFPMEFRGDRRHEIMKTDIAESEKDFTLSVEVPGLDKKDINLALEDGYLNITATKEESSGEKDKKGNYIRRERSFGSYQRSFYVGENVKENNIKAKMDKGVLTVVIDKVKETPVNHPSIMIE